MSNTIYLDNNALRSLAADSRFTGKWPIIGTLNSVSQSAGGCSACSGKSKTVDAAYNTVKRAIAELDDASARELLIMLGATEVRVAYSDGSQAREAVLRLRSDAS